MKTVKNLLAGLMLLSFAPAVLAETATELEAKAVAAEQSRDAAKAVMEKAQADAATAQKAYDDFCAANPKPAGINPYKLANDLANANAASRNTTAAYNVAATAAHTARAAADKAKADAPEADSSTPEAKDERGFFGKAADKACSAYDKSLGRGKHNPFRIRTHEQLMAAATDTEKDGKAVKGSRFAKWVVGMDKDGNVDPAKGHEVAVARAQRVAALGATTGATAGLVWGATKLAKKALATKKGKAALAWVKGKLPKGKAAAKPAPAQGYWAQRRAEQAKARAARRR